MQLDGVSALDVTSSTPSVAQGNNQTQPELRGLGQDSFMKLLLAQLQNQDPLKPMEDKDFIAQLTQFNSLNQLTQMNQTLTELMTAQALSQASALIGKEVSGLASTGGGVTGLVSGLHLSGGKVNLEVDGQQVPLDTIQTIKEAPRSDDNDEQDQSIDQTDSGDQSDSST
jgi:flagellar basal-body rod modification protein FlgD